MGFSTFPVPPFLLVTYMQPSSAIIPQCKLGPSGVSCRTGSPLLQLTPGSPHFFFLCSGDKASDPCLPTSLLRSYCSTLSITPVFVVSFVLTSFAHGFMHTERYPITLLSSQFIFFFLSFLSRWCFVLSPKDTPGDPLFTPPQPF